MVHALYDQETRPRITIEVDQSRRTELLGIPVAQHLLVSDLRRMAVILQMVLIGERPLNIELARIPFAALARRLRPEMHPDAELRIPQPLRRARIVGLDRAPCRLVGARRHRQIEFLLGKSGHVTHRHRVLGQGAVHRRHRLQIVIHTRIRLSAARGEARPSSAHLHPAPAVFSGHSAQRLNAGLRPPYNARGMRNCVILNLYKYIN